MCVTHYTTNRMRSKGTCKSGILLSGYYLYYHCIWTESEQSRSHYYRGRYRVTDASSKHLLYDERKFEDTLIENDFIFHYKHLRETVKNGKTTVIEKGIDTWFALDTYEMAQFRDFDYTVMISGDADHEMLARKLRALKTHVVLLTWDPAETGSTSRFLKEEVCTHIDINKLVKENPALLNRLCI